MEDKNIMLLVTGFVLLIIGVSLLIPSSNLISGVVTKKASVDETINIASARLGGGEINPNTTFTVTNAPTSWKTTDCPLTSVVYGNASDDFVLDTDYTFTASTGVLKLLNTDTTNATGAGSNTTLIDYTYCGDDYLNSDWQRSVLNLTPGFWAVAMLLISIGIFFMVAKSEGILDKI
jgi:hypothetical protein